MDTESQETAFILVAIFSLIVVSVVTTFLIMDYTIVGDAKTKAYVEGYKDGEVRWI